MGHGRSGADDVFLNIPYDESVVDLFLAYIAGLTTMGLFPHATLEIPGGESRLDRTIQLIGQCPYSVHELSPITERKSSRKRPLPPRLNMAFELGLVVARDRARPGEHTWFLFADSQIQLGRSLSDLAGTDSYFHGTRPRGIFRELGNAFVRNQRPPTVQQMEHVFRGLVHGLPELKRRTGSKSPFSASVFSGLRALASTLTQRTD